MLVSWAEGDWWGETGWELGTRLSLGFLSLCNSFPPELILCVKALTEPRLRGNTFFFLLVGYLGYPSGSLQAGLRLGYETETVVKVECLTSTMSFVHTRPLYPNNANPPTAKQTP